MNYACKCCKLDIVLERDGFTYALDGKSLGSYIVCNPCRIDLERAAKGGISKEKFGKLVEERWEKGRQKIIDAASEAVKQGWRVQVIESTGSKSAEKIKCCEILGRFGKLNDKERAEQYSSCWIIVNGLREKGKLCSDCSEKAKFYF